jgi:putative glycosyltransferase (TIGR04372 family)
VAGADGNMMILPPSSFKHLVRRQLGAETTIFLSEWLRFYLEKTKRVASFVRPGYWRFLNEYKRFVRDGYRFVKISNPHRIGHLCLEADALLKDIMMQGQDTSKLILVDQQRFANSHIVEYLKKYLTVQTSSPVFDFIQSYGDPEGATIETGPYGVAMYKTARAYETYAKWDDRPSLFKLTDQDRQALQKYLREVGVPDWAWYACVHARQGGYSPEDEGMHRYRSVDITSFSLAIEEIVRRGGWCIRVGDASMRPYPPHERVIDYALSAQKSQQLDVLLAAGCRFFLGSGSGLFNVAELFGRPCVIAHMSPLSCAYGYSPADISIPQRLRKRGGNYLALADIMKDQCAVFRSAKEFEAADLENVPNTAVDIRDAVVEMLDRLDGKVVYTEDDIRRQANFRSLFRDGHYAFGATSSIGRDFLRKYSE